MHVYIHKMSDGRSCLWSQKTAVEVKSCPVTKEQWDERARIKNCQPLAHVQNCTKSSNFKYHCVINEFEDAFIEVCAPVYNINGKIKEKKKKNVYDNRYSKNYLKLDCYQKQSLD